MSDGASEGLEDESGLGAGASDGASARDLSSTSAATSRASAASGATVTAARRSNTRNMARAIVGLIWLSGAVVFAVCGMGVGVALFFMLSFCSTINEWCGMLFIGEGEDGNGHGVCT